MSRSVQAPSLKGRRILIVEDEYMVADDMALDFRGLGAEIVGPVSTIEKALACVRENEKIDGAVLDINLNGEMAFPIADALKAKGVPFLFATGYERWSLPNAYADVVLCEKPVDSARVATALFP